MWNAIAAIVASLFGLDGFTCQQALTNILRRRCYPQHTEEKELPVNYETVGRYIFCEASGDWVAKYESNLMNLYHEDSTRQEKPLHI